MHSTTEIKTLFTEKLDKNSSCDMTVLRTVHKMKKYSSNIVVLDSFLIF